LSGNIYIEFSSYVIGMFQKQPEDLKCTEEPFKEFYLKDHLDKFVNFNYLLSQESQKHNFKNFS